MKIRKVLVLILLVLTLSLTTTLIVMPQISQTPTSALTQTLAPQQSAPKGITIIWGNEIKANTNFTSDQEFPSICCFPDGSFVVAWQGSQTGDEDVYVKVFDSTGGNLTDDIRVNGHTSGDQSEPSVSCFPDGSGFVVAWHSFDGAYDIYAKVFNSTWDNMTDDVSVTTHTGSTQYAPSVCCLSSEVFVVTWGSYNQPGGEGWDIYAQILNKTGDSQIPDDILVNSNTSDWQEFPSVSCYSDASGFVVAWYGNQAGDRDIYVRVFNETGGDMTGDILVNINTTSWQTDSSVRCFPDNSGFVVAWRGNQTGDWDVYVRVFNATGNPRTGGILVNTETTNYQEYPSVCCRPDGSFIVAWQSDHYVTYDVYAKLFSTTGGSMTDDILVNNYTTNPQTYPSVCCRTDGSFIVAWQSSGQDTSGYGVYFRRGIIETLPLVLPIYLALFFIQQSGGGVGIPLLIGGVLAVAVVLGVLILWRFRRGT